MFWSWLREKVKDAVLAGCADAVQELEGEEAADPGEAVALLRARLRPALPAPAPDGNGEHVGKAKARKGQR